MAASCADMEVGCRWIAPSAAGVLRYTEVGDVPVLALLVACSFAAWLALSRRMSPLSLRRAFACFVGVFVAGMVTWGLVDAPSLNICCLENHYIEWLSADLIFIAWVLSMVLLVRSARGRGWPKTRHPLATVLAAGYFWGFWRELEWAKPFIGHKLIYTRNFFRLGPYLSASYFEDLSRSKGVSSSLMFALHWASALTLAVCAVFAAAWALRHREQLRREIRQMPKALWGRCFLVGCGIFVAAQGLGAILHRVLSIESMRHWRTDLGIEHQVLDEPLELLAAACFAMSAIALWHETNGGRLEVAPVELSTEGVKENTEIHH